MLRSMALEPDRVERPLRQMRRLLKELADDPTPEQVHRLRTRARRIEAAAGALQAADERAARRLVKVIRPVRKAAGTVRDMDVLTEKLLAMPREDNDESLGKLVEKISRTRQTSAAELLATVHRQRKKARKRLKEYAQIVSSAARAKKPVQRAAPQALDSGTEGDSAAHQLLDELRRWPALDQRNLHGFRLKVKQLRYVLQMFPHPDANLVDSLAGVKDHIGDWHDWEQLFEIASQMLDARADHALLQHIEAISRRKYMQALAGANGLRRRFQLQIVLRARA